MVSKKVTFQRVRESTYIKFSNENVLTKREEREISPLVSKREDSASFLNSHLSLHLGKAAWDLSLGSPPPNSDNLGPA